MTQFVELKTLLYVKCDYCVYYLSNIMYFIVEWKTVLYVNCNYYVFYKHTTKNILICIKCSILFQIKLCHI